MDSRDSLISYKSISQESDAFIFSEQFVPYFDLEINGIFSADNLEFEKYTAGSTDNPEDYKLPDVNNIVLPNKLSRINVFNKNNKESLLVSCDNSETANESSIDLELISEDALLFAQFFNNRETKIKRKKSNDNSVYISKSDDSFEEITLKHRFFSNEKSKSIDENYSINVEKESKSDNANPNIVNDIRNTSSINNNKYEYKTIKEGSRIINSDQNFSYDLYSDRSTNVYDFTSKVDQSSFLTEMKNELILNFDQKITKLENNVVNNNITRQEINQIENNIVQVIENKLKHTEEQILEKIDQKSDEKIKKFRNNFLNS
jgi:hypothetical protein